MSSSQTARRRARAELTQEIVDIARGQLATSGAAGLSLRAVAREMGMVSSAVYRYFPSRDDLLTRLIIDGYDAVGEAVEQADAAVDPDDVTGRWVAVCHAVRTWALAHPHEYALLHGSPVPGYRAPDDTVGPAARDAVVYGRILSDAWASGRLVLPDGGPPAPAPLADDLEAVRAMMPGVPDAVVVRAVALWATLYGMVSFEVFGTFDTVVRLRDVLFDHTVRSLAAWIGLPGT
ncbi:TetR/AcrR family transcriptional regulator [Antribacter sp. KLBMP9083]|uniref:TetR/AcrR family transcriptional regulator n=1 Tax=Antribacter soli TaxID=2910976 RepID=A0AA41QG50_9MICO|nr:TetR/AcrR family transcriptional regulator [Antribacter soli]MCF4122527.1 TetR/AcrR family transcriptional regulator [Antribacter soli]